MAQIQCNPWSFTPSDQAVSRNISSIVNQTRSILVTTSAAHGFVEGDAVSLQGLTTVPRYRGGFRITAVPSATTLLIQSDYQFIALPNSGAHGQILSAVYLDMVRAEQILWNNPALGNRLVLTDVIGNQVYSGVGAADPPSPYTYGKLYWIRGLVIKEFSGGAEASFQITIN